MMIAGRTCGLGKSDLEEAFFMGIGGQLELMSWKEESTMLETSLTHFANDKRQMALRERSTGGGKLMLLNTNLHGGEDHGAAA